MALRPSWRTADPAALARGILAGERAVVARAITLIESRRSEHQAAARELVQVLLPRTGQAVRVGVTGVPGVGKSTTIDALGSLLTERGHKVAVLAVDPSSARTGGSILADKTRMARLANDPNAFVRPSPGGGTLGGVAAKTRECMLICEAAGFDVLLVETIGTGQSETAVADMTDFFLVLMLPGAGDEFMRTVFETLEAGETGVAPSEDGSTYYIVEVHEKSSEAELAKLRATVKQISCSQCGAPVNLATDSACTHCGAAIALIDPDGIVKALRELDGARVSTAREQENTKTMLSDTQLNALFDLERMRDRDDDGRQDLLAIGAAAIGAVLGSWLS